jgi:hypothetical protein
VEHGEGESRAMQRPAMLGRGTEGISASQVCVWRMLLGPLPPPPSTQFTRWRPRCGCELVGPQELPENSGPLCRVAASQPAQQCCTD